MSRGQESFEVAGLRCLLLGTGEFSVAASTVFPAAPPAELESARHRFGCPSDPMVFEVHPLFIQTESHRVLIDPGATAGGASIVEELETRGIAAESIDTVILTHGHADHWSSGVVVEGDLGWEVPGRRAVRPAFENARYVIQHDEWEGWFKDPNSEEVHALPFRNILGPLRDHFDLIRGEDEIVHGVEVYPTPGHSPGHQVVVIGGAAIHVGDVLLHPICVEHPEWTAAFDVQPQRVVESRIGVLDLAAADDLLVITPHFPWPGLGRVRKASGQRRWEYGRA